jgi:hypothetical protein
MKSATRARVTQRLAPLGSVVEAGVELIDDPLRTYAVRVYVCQCPCYETARRLLPAGLFLIAVRGKASRPGQADQ